VERADLIVVGAGAAGLYASLTAAREGARVALVSARPLAETASYWAQGGLAAALAADDSPELHEADTLAAGRGIVRRSAARVLVDEAPGIVRDLQDFAGVRALAIGTPDERDRLEAAADAGARAASTILVRLPHELKDLFREWLETHAPGRAKRVLALIAEARGGKLYDSSWSRRMTGEGAYAQFLRQRFEKTCRRLGLDRRNIAALDTNLFRAPSTPDRQLPLFD
jgi:glycine/D-amino acid oxidase-like deaminating enzyme